MRHTGRYKVETVDSIILLSQSRKPSSDKNSKSADRYCLTITVEGAKQNSVKTEFDPPRHMKVANNSRKPACIVRIAGKDY